MNNTQKHGSWLIVFFFNIFFDDLAQRFITGLVALYNIPYSFVNHNDMIILIDNLQIVSGRIGFHCYLLFFRLITSCSVKNRHCPRLIPHLVNPANVTRSSFTTSYPNTSNSFLTILILEVLTSIPTSVFGLFSTYSTAST